MSIDEIMLGGKKTLNLRNIYNVYLLFLRSQWAACLILFLWVIDLLQVHTGDSSTRIWLYKVTSTGVLSSALDITPS